jgi:hypothetical protein
LIERERSNWKRPLKALICVALFFIAVLLSLQAVALIRFDAGVFARSAEALLERSRQIRDRARAGYQGETLARLRSNPNSGRFFRLDDRAPEAAPVAGADEWEDPSDSGGILDLEFDHPDDPGLVPAHGRAIPVVDGGLLRIRTVTSDYLTSSTPLEIRRSEVGEFAIRARVSGPSRMTLGWHARDVPENIWRDSVDIQLIPDNQFHTYVIDAKPMLRRSIGTGDIIRRLILQPSHLDDVEVEVDFLRVVSKIAKYRKRRWGTTYEVLENDMRQVLYMLPDTSIEYALTLPVHEPTLDVGTGVLYDDSPVDFEIRLELSDPAETVTLLDVRSETATAWREHRIDLASWAGRDVRLVLSARGSSENVAFWSNPIVRSAPETPFNIVLLVEDTLRADHLSTYGYHLETSPARSQLVERNGILFRHAVSQATKTRPSVPALMTSLLPTTTGVWNTHDVLDDSYLTLAEILRSQGFVTAARVQNSNAGPPAGLHQGFSEIVDPGGLAEGPQGVLGLDLDEWLERHRDQNFFLYLHILDPHGPYEPPAPFDDLYQEVEKRGAAKKFDYRLDPPWQDRPTVAGRRLLYDGEIRHNDSWLRKFFQMLDHHGMSQHTLLVLTSDHGEHLGEREEWAHHPPGYLRAIHVPLMMVYPERFSGFRAIDPVVQLIDVMPTILELAGVESGELLMQGDSLVDLADGSRADRWRDRIAVSEEPSFMTREAPYSCGSLFFRGWHLLSSRPFVPRVGGWRPPPVLGLKVFDYAERPEEDRALLTFLPDLYIRHRYSRIVRELQANGLIAWERLTSRSEQVRRLDPDALDQLRSLGYIEEE